MFISFDSHAFNDTNTLGKDDNCYECFVTIYNYTYTNIDTHTLKTYMS